MTRHVFILLSIILVCFGCGPKFSHEVSPNDTTMLRIEYDTVAEALSVFRSDEKKPILTRMQKKSSVRIYIPSLHLMEKEF